LVGWRRLAVIRILAGIHEGVVPRDCCLEHFARHCAPLIWASLDLACQFFDSVRLEKEPAFFVDPRRLRDKLLTLHGVGIEYRPEGAAAVETFRIPGPLRRLSNGLTPARRAQRAAAQRFFVEPLAVLLDHDGVLPIGDLDSCGASLEEGRAVREKRRSAV